MKTYDVTFEITVNVEAESEEHINSVIAVKKAEDALISAPSLTYLKEIKEYTL